MDQYTVHIEEGDLLAEQGLFDEAMGPYLDAVDLDPTRVEAHMRLGVAAGGMGRYADAAVSLREAIRVDPTFTDAHMALGVLLIPLKRYDEAEEAFREAIRLDPTNAATYICLEFALRHLGRDAEAEEAYQEAIRLDPDGSSREEMYGVLASVSSRWGRYREAMAAAQEELKRPLNEVGPKAAKAAKGALFGWSHGWGIGIGFTLGPKGFKKYNMFADLAKEEALDRAQHPGAH